LEKRLRLAPSPTGLFHIGTARTALFNWLYAQKIGGKFLIRIEDTDFLRSKSEYTENILEGLKWLGLNWDEEPIKQSDRISNHKSYIKKLLECGAAYRCFTTEDEIYEFMSDKYGDWIVFKPQFNTQNSLLWILPYIALIFGGFFIFSFLKKRQ